MADATLTDYDLMVLVAFETKAQSEGENEYTFENWTWKFETAALNERGASFAGFMELLRENRNTIDAWDAAHVEDACDLINAHHDEARRREDDACLWAGRRNDGQIFPVKTREQAEWYLKPGNMPADLTFTLQTREAPGGAWIDAPTPATTQA